jgi:hypothetical protein
MVMMAKAGVWMAPGQPNMKLNLLDDQKIEFGSLDGSFTTPPHGFYTEIHTPDGSCRLVCFHCTGNESKLVAHTLYEVHPGYWRSPKHWETWLDISAITVSPVGLPGTTPMIGEELQVKHRMLWLHPSRSPQYLYLLHTGDIVWSDGERCGPANGFYDYSCPTSAGDMDHWYVNFHYMGDVDKTQGTLLERVTGNVPAWRAIGALEAEVPPMFQRYSSRDVRPWHIIMVSL